MRVDGQLQDTSWDTCLDDLAARLKAIIDEHGPRAVGLFTGGGGYLDAASAAVTEMGGHIAKKLGDGLMVLFGYPVGSEVTGFSFTAGVLIASTAGSCFWSIAFMSSSPPTDVS